jgi:hypothetical protein
MTRMKSLWFVGTVGSTFQMGDEGLRALLAKPLPSLEILHLGACGITAEGVGAFTRYEGTIERLTLNHNAIGDDGLRELADAKCLRECQALFLTGTEIGDDGVAALAKSPHLGKLRRLALNHNEGVSDTALASLRASAVMKKLHTVETDGCEDVGERWS